MKKFLGIIVCLLILCTLTIPAFAAEKFTEDFTDATKLTYFKFEGDGFKLQDGAFVSKSTTKYNAAYFGQYYENCVFEFDFKDFGGGGNTGGVSLRVASTRYDLEVCSNSKNNDEKLIVWKGGPNKKASNTMAETGKGVPNIPEGQWVKIKVALTKDNMKVYVDNVLYLDYTDVFPYATGGFGLRSANSNIGYDNLKIDDLSVTNSTSTSTSSSSSVSINSQTSSSSKVTSSSSSSTTSISSSSTQQQTSSDSSEVTTASTSKDDSDGSNGNLPLIIILIAVIVLGGGGAALYFFVLKKKI